MTEVNLSWGRDKIPITKLHLPGSNEVGVKYKIDPFFFFFFFFFPFSNLPEFVTLHPV